MANNLESEKKIYIEVGANDGIFQSRSLNLANNEGYHGILIEASAGTFNQCVRNRSNGRTSFYNCALVSFETERNTSFIKLHHSNQHNAMHNILNWENSIFSEEVRARSLDSILEEECISEIDYFFLDVEGYELEVLKGIDFSKRSFNTIEIESHLFFNKKTREQENNDFQSILGENYIITETVKGDGLDKIIFKKK